MLLAIFNAIVAVASAIPIFDGWLKQFVAWYIQNQIASMKKEDQAVIAKALLDQNQIPIETLIGYAQAGKPSGTPGTKIVDSLPGVK